MALGSTRSLKETYFILQEYFLGGKGDRCIRPTTLPLHVSIVSKSGSLNLVEPSGPVLCLYRDCVTFALPFTYTDTCIHTYTYARTCTLAYTYKVNEKCTAKLQELNQTQRQKRNMLHDVRTNTSPLVIWLRS